MQLVHCDIYGPINPVSAGGAKYVLAVMDDHTGYAYIETIASRADVPEVLPKLLRKMETESGYKLVRFRTYGGTELMAR